MLTHQIGDALIILDPNGPGDEPTIAIQATPIVPKRLAGAIESASPVTLSAISGSDIEALTVVFVQSTPERALPIELHPSGPEYIESHYSEAKNGGGIAAIESDAAARAKVAKSIISVADSTGHTHFEWYRVDDSWYGQTISWIIGPKHS